MGHIYKRGNVYWIKYHKQGKPYYESTRSKKEADAKRLLKKREGEIANGKLPGIVFDKVRFEDLAEDLRTDYKLNQRKSLSNLECRIGHLNDSFENMRVSDITTPLVASYVETRIGEGAANATINRELAALKRALTIGARQTPPKVDRVPYIPMLKENNARKGFFEHNEYIALHEALPSYLKGLITFAYKTGWRISEVTGLTWNQVDLNQNVVRLEVGETKNNEGRTVYLDDELQEVFKIQKKQRKKLISQYVFPHPTGRKINDIRKSMELLGW